MSGIAVVFNTRGEPASPDMLDRMLDAIQHRGPDRRSSWLDQSVGLGHTLLQTTPESLREQQPIADWRAECRIVWDGRLDNRAELIARCRTEELLLGAETDPEIVLAAYRLWGRECVMHLLGDFAFVIWDSRTHSLMAARDRLGVKPLYYSVKGTRLLMASEAKGLLAVLDRMPDPDDEIVLALLLGECRSADHHRSLFTGIHRLPPGHLMWTEDGQVRLQQYWTLDPSKLTHRNVSSDDLIDQFRTLLQEAVACRLRSAFPVGSLLSGGLDSSAVTAFAASSARMPVEAFTSYSPTSDERSFARVVAEAAQIPLWEILAKPVNMLDGLEDVLWSMESLMVVTAEDRQSLQEQLSARKCRIVLDGHGGDQLLSEFGYLLDVLIRRGPAQFFKQARCFAQWYTLPLSSLVTMTGKALLPNSVKIIGKHLLRGIPPAWINADLARRVDWMARVRQPRGAYHASSASQDCTANGVIEPYYHFELEVGEREAAAAGREAWHPFLDSRLAEFVVSIPWQARCRGGVHKWLLREAMRGVLPEPVRARRGKGDTSADFDQRLLELCVRSSPIENRSGILQRYINLPGATHLVERYRGGAHHVRWNVWSLVVLDRFLNRFYQGGAVDGITSTPEEAVYVA